MSTSLNAFVTESNVELYLSRLYTTLDATDRDNLLRLLVEEESKMGRSLEHVENGERRVADGCERLKRQRTVVAGLPIGKRHEHPAARLLETLEQTQALLEQHLRCMRASHERHKL